MKKQPDTILFFDGYCPFCHFWVGFIIKRDQKKRIYFASLEGPTGKKFLEERNLKGEDSLVLWHPQVAYYTKSVAVFEILRLLGGGYHIIRVFSILPKVFTDAIYSFVARNRFKFQKRYDSCPLPDPSVRDRFIE